MKNLAGFAPRLHVDVHMYSIALYFFMYTKYFMLYVHMYSIVLYFSAYTKIIYHIESYVGIQYDGCVSLPTYLGGLFCCPWDFSPGSSSNHFIFFLLHRHKSYRHELQRSSVRCGGYHEMGTGHCCTVLVWVSGGHHTPAIWPEAVDGSRGQNCWCVQIHVPIGGKCMFILSIWITSDIFCTYG